MAGRDADTHVESEFDDASDDRVDSSGVPVGDGVRGMGAGGTSFASAVNVEREVNHGWDRIWGIVNRFVVSFKRMFCIRSRASEGQSAMFDDHGLARSAPGDNQKGSS